MQAVSVIKAIITLLIVTVPVTASATGADVRSDFYRAQLNDRSTPSADRLTAYDSLISRHPADEASLLYSRGCLLRDNNRTQEALLSFLQAYGLKDRLAVDDRLETMYCISSMQNDFGWTTEGALMARRLLEEEKPDSLSYYDGKAQMVLYNIGMSINDLEAAERALADGIRSIEKAKGRMPGERYGRLMGALALAKGALLTRRVEPRQAYRVMTDAAKYDASLPESVAYNSTMGNFYASQGEFDIAERYYTKAVKSRSTDVVNRCGAVINLAVTRVDRRDYRGALDVLERYGTLLDSLGNSPLHEQLASVRSEIYEGLGDYRRALLYRHSVDSVRSSRLSPAALRSIDSCMTVIREEEMMRQAESRRGYGALTWVLAGLLLPAVAAVTAIAVKFRKRGRENEFLRRDAEDASRRCAEAVGAEEQQGQRMSSMAAQLAHVSESLEVLKEMAANPRVRKTEIVGEIERATRNLSASAHVWEPFMEYFNGVNQSFFDKLYRLHPDLSNSEVRLCAFILLNRTTKEIATILNRSPRTVESAKYSLRRKMRLRDISTEAYIRGISATPLEDLVKKTE